MVSFQEKESLFQLQKNHSIFLQYLNKEATLLTAYRINW